MNSDFGVDPIPGLTRLTPDKTKLKILNGPKAEYCFALNQMRLVLGRNDPPMIKVDIDFSACELSDPPMISRRHAEIQWANGNLEIVDLCSSNGTFVDGQKLTPLDKSQPSTPMVLKLGSKITLANLECEIIVV